MKSRNLRAILTVSIAVAAVVATATPAFAVTARVLPTGYSLYAVNCDTVSPNLQLFSIDTATADATTIGAGANINGSDCAAQPAWDAATNTAYYTTFSDTDALASVNLVTGVSTRVADLTFGGDTTSVDAIAISPTGTAYAIANRTIYSLDLTTGVLTNAVSTTLRGIYGFAANPTSGTFYTIDYNGLISTINPTTGVATTLGQANLPDSNSTNPYSLQIDGNGTLWVENDGADADLWTINPADVTGSAQLVNPISLNGTQFYTEALLIAPTPTPPTITTAPGLAAAIAGTPFRVTIAATGSAPITFAQTAGTLPAGLTFDPVTGVISGTPTTPGTFSFTITATNASGTAAVIFTQTVSAHLPVVSG